MGLNVDLTQMLGAPKTVVCPRCNTGLSSMFDDYDIECGNPNPAPGEWQLSCFCVHCEHEWKHCFKVAVSLGSSDERFFRGYPATAAHSIVTTYKGIAIAIAPCFSGPQFYEGFAERCAVQLDHVLNAAGYAFIDYIEVVPGQALIHYRRVMGSHIPDLMTQVVDVGSWKPPLGEL